MDLYHFDFATDPTNAPNVLDSAVPKQNGYIFDFADPGKDLHVFSKSGFSECHDYGNSIGTGSRCEFFPDASHNVVTDQITVEAWINLHHVFGTQTVFSSESALMNVVGNSLEVRVFFNNGTTFSVIATGAVKNAFDEHHACDPAVVKGKFFYDGITNSWAMFYLGEDISPNIIMHNQIGVAFASSLAGPWKKWSKNPIIPFSSYNAWGVGQACATSIDNAGRLMLFYGKGDETESKMVWRELDLSDMSAPFIGPENTVLTNGLTERDGSSVFFNNANFAYNNSRDIFFLFCASHPHYTNFPDFIASELLIPCIDAIAIWSGSGTWEVLAHINSGHSGFPRNHNSGILRNAYGVIPDPAKLSVIFAVSAEATGWDWLGSYRLHTISGQIPEPAVLGFFGVIVLAFQVKFTNK